MSAQNWPASAGAPQFERWSGIFFRGIVYLLLTLLGVSMIFPYLWMLANSLKTEPEFYEFPYRLLPAAPTLEPYYLAITIGYMGRFMLNSALYAIIVLIVQTIINSLAAYAFARTDFPGRDAIFLVVLSTMMLPFSVLLIPTYLIVYYLGLANTVGGVVIPAFASAFGIFFLRQFMLSIPRELEDAAIIDGANHLQIYLRLIMPLSKPAILTLCIFAFLNEWNAFIWPLVVLSDWKRFPVTVGISMLHDQSGYRWPNLFAASTLVSFPIILFFVIVQKHIIGGLTLSGLKG
jgi:multiple sugar transport system permease protein